MSPIDFVKSIWILPGLFFYICTAKKIDGMITKVHIKGYKSIYDQEIELRPINILIGGNGIGKTNFISSFSLMRNLYEKNLQAYVLRKGGANALLFMGKKRTQEIEFDFYFKRDDYQNRYIVDLFESQERLLIKSTETAFFSAGKWYFQICDQYSEEASIQTDLVGQAWYVNPLMKQFEVYHFHDTGDTSPMKSFSSLHDNVALRKDGSNIAAFLYYLKARHPKHYMRIEKMVESVSPFFDSFYLEPNRLNPETIRLEWKQKNSEDTYFSAYQLSDGTLRFICLATLLMQPEPPTTIIIDEPELGLHPFAVTKLAALIRGVSKKSQVIISTQSVNLVDNFAPEDIIVVDMKDNASIFRRLEQDELKVWMDEYSMGEIWEKNLIGGQPF